LRNLSIQNTGLKSEISELEGAINQKKISMRLQGYSSPAARAQIENELSALVAKLDSKRVQSVSLNQQILALINAGVTTNVQPVYRIRGFFPFPEPIVRVGGNLQEVVQFKVQYKYLSLSGSESPTEPFKFDNGTTGAFSNWNEFTSLVRKRSFNSSTGVYTWKVEDVSNPDVPNINQLDIPIKVNEKVEIRVKSISEVGFPESPMESDWSQPITIEFPESLANSTSGDEQIKDEALRAEVVVAIRNEFSSLGLNEHLADQVSLAPNTYFHTSDHILSGFEDQIGNPLNLKKYIEDLTNRIKVLEEKVNRVKGELGVYIIRNSQIFPIQNNSKLEFTVECEDYLKPYQRPGIPSGRVYANDIYKVEDFLLQIKNKSLDSPLGLLSIRNYNANTSGSVYNSSAPQVFWVDSLDSLIVSNATGQTKTQIDNQFLWCVNYDSVMQTTVDKLASNIGNDFRTKGKNSVTDVLSSNKYNLGFSNTGILDFNNNNLSLLDPSKWISTAEDVQSTTKLLTTVHAQVPNLENIQETNADRVRYIDSGEENNINIPLKIYFKMNATDNSKPGVNYEYINLNGISTTTKHIKKVKFLLDNENDNQPFIFSITFIINRAKIAVSGTVESTPTSTPNVIAGT
jgi:hypothetical protein